MIDHNRAANLHIAIFSKQNRVTLMAREIMQKIQS